MKITFEYVLVTIEFIISTASISQARQVLVANLSGAQEVPAVTAGGKGACRIILNAAQTQITVNCRYSGLSSAANAAHIHGNAAVAPTAPVLSDFGTVSGTSGTITPSPIAVTAQQVADLRANKMYVDIHTANNANGEIRGQLHIANAYYNDYDGDGKTDPTVFRPSDGTWYSLLSLNGTAGFQNWGLATDLTAQNYDFDGDGISDYAAIRVNPNTGGLITYILQSETNSMRVEQFGSAALGDQTDTGDFDGDGKVDLGAIRNESGGYVWYILQSSNNQARNYYWGKTDDR